MLIHNSTFLVGLLVASVASYVDRQIQQQETTAAAGPDKEPALEEQAARSLRSASALPDSPELLWLGRFWLFFPQIVALVLAFSLGQAALPESLPQLHHAGRQPILLAYWATRERVRDMRSACRPQSC